MTTLLLIIIYIAFIGLGLPDGLLGAAWPVMHLDIQAALPLAGVVSFIITCGTILSSLLSDRLTRRFGAGLVTAVSVGMTAAALVGFAFSRSFWQLCLWALPYGLGAGAVDAALNNVIALHYSAKHMSWLHCFWGVGASVGPYIMGVFLTGTLGWHGGYTAVAIIQIVICAALFLSLSFWKCAFSSHENDIADNTAPIGLRTALNIRGVKAILAAFFAYCAAEMTAMLWSSSYLTVYRGVDEQTAAFLASLFYIGMMVGRFVNGFLAERFSDKHLIRTGIVITLCGIVLTALPLASSVPAMVGLLIIGLGCAPIYPCIIHSTPIHFGKHHSQVIIGIEMASAYTGSCLMPPLFGFLADRVTMGLFPFFLLFFFTILLIMTERVNRTHHQLNHTEDTP